MNECEHPDFDPYTATIDEEYFQSFTACKDPECEVHGSPPEIHWDPQRLPLLTLAGTLLPS